ncbi:MAG: TM0106 family RecB-like putative nuclease, partial [Thermoguttaceae bacterium]
MHDHRFIDVSTNADQKSKSETPILTRESLEASLHCSYKAYLRTKGEEGTKTEYEIVLAELRETLARKATERIRAACKPDEVPSGMRVAASVLKQGKPFIFDATVAADLGDLRLDGLKRVPGFSKLGDFHYIPLLFQPGTKVRTEHKAVLEAFGHVLTAVQGKSPDRAVVYHGDECRATTLRLSPNLGKGRILLDRLRELHKSPSAPQLRINDHCPVCEFSERCRQQAIAEGNLSLLRGLSPKELRTYAKKGIFTITQLACTFRPRRRSKGTKPSTRHHHALQAMAVRDNTVYVLGTPELRSAPVQVYLDVEGDPDSGHVYLIGMVIVEGTSEKRFSFWADERNQETQMFQQFMAVLDHYDDFLVFCYGAYEKTFLRRMRSQVRGKKRVDRILARLVNVLAIVYSHIYFPCYSNGLKDIGRWLGCTWAERQASGLQAAAWRMRWETDHSDELKRKLCEYNLEDCDALRKLWDFIHAVIPRISEPSGSRAVGSHNAPIVAVQENEKERFDWKWGQVKF